MLFSWTDVHFISRFRVTIERSGIPRSLDKLDRLSGVFPLLPFFEIARILKCLEESQRYGNVVSEQHVRDFDGQ